jgi:hypothetical protein
VARMGEGRGVHRVFVGKPEGTRPLGRPRRNGRIILRWIFRKWEGVVGQVAGTCGYGNELSVSMNAGKFLTSCKTG